MAAPSHKQTHIRTRSTSTKYVKNNERVKSGKEFSLLLVWQSHMVRLMAYSERISTNKYTLNWGVWKTTSKTIKCFIIHRDYTHNTTIKPFSCLFFFCIFPHNKYHTGTLIYECECVAIAVIVLFSRGRHHNISNKEDLLLSLQRNIRYVRFSRK